MTIQSIRQAVQSALPFSLIVGVLLFVGYRLRFVPVSVRALQITNASITNEVLGTGTLEARVRASISPKIQGRIAISRFAIHASGTSSWRTRLWDCLYARTLDLPAISSSRPGYRRGALALAVIVFVISVLSSLLGIVKAMRIEPHKVLS